MSGGGSNSVRNLLAKFENNGSSNNTTTATTSTSPPSRGRSPIGTNGAALDRPVSKVRASFVAVERVSSPGVVPGGGPQQLWGLRMASDVSSSSDKPKVDGLGSPISRSAAVSPTSSVDKPALERVPTLSPPSSSFAEMRNSLAAKFEATAKAKAKAEDSPVTSPAAEKGDESRLGDILKGSPFEESPGKKRVASGSTAPKEETVASEPKVDKKPKETTVPKKQATITVKKTARPNNITTGKDASKAAPAKRSPKSPPLPRTPKMPATPGRRQASTTTNTPVSKKEVERPSRVANKKPSTVRASSHPAGGKPPAKARAQPSGLSKESHGGRSSSNTSPRSIRGKLKSPTRPVRIPAASTATSAARLKAESEASRPGSRATGDTTRKVPPAKGPAANLRQTTSTIRKAASHASLAPAANISDRPGSRVSNATSRSPDDSFLARMMRPTASSASKMHDKTDIKSPPRSASKKTPPQQRKVSGRQSAQPKTSSRSSSAEAPPADEEAAGPPEEVATEPNTLPPMEEVEEPIVEEQPKEEKAPEDIPLPAETEV